MSAAEFYDALAPYYHLVYADWEASIARQGQALAATIRSAGGPHLRTVLDAACAQRVHREGLLNYLDDNQNAWQLEADGSYRKLAPAAGEAPFSAQLSLLDELYA